MNSSNFSKIEQQDLSLFSDSISSDDFKVSSNQLRSKQKENKPHKETTSPDYLGHRKRVLNKIIEKGANALTDEELVEFLLMRVIPQRDVKPFMKALFRRFNTLHGIISADPLELQQVNGIKETGIALFKCIQSACERITAPTLKKGSILKYWDEMIDFCRIKLGSENIEHAMAIYLDHTLRVKAISELHRGTNNRTAIYPREILRDALNTNAHAVVLCHNHPSGSAYPSQADRIMTNEIKDILNQAGIRLEDHIILAQDGLFSFKMCGLLKQRLQPFNQGKTSFTLVDEPDEKNKINAE